MSTVAEAIDETKDHIYGNTRPVVDMLGAALDTTNTTVTLTVTAAVAKGTILSVGLETMYVVSYNPESFQALVIRGWRSSPASTHETGDPVEINPRFATHRIWRALQSDILSWPNDLYVPLEYAFEPASPAATGGNNLQVELEDEHDNVTRLIAVRWADNNGYWHSAPRARLRQRDGLHHVVEFGDLFTGGEMSIILATPFDMSAFELTTDLVADVGLQESMTDIPPLGAAWKLVGVDEIRRSQRQVAQESRMAEEVPPMHMMQTSANLKTMYRARMAEEIRRLQERYQVRSW